MLRLLQRSLFTRAAVFGLFAPHSRRAHACVSLGLPLDDSEALAVLYGTAPRGSDVLATVTAATPPPPPPNEGHHVHTTSPRHIKGRCSALRYAKRWNAHTATELSRRLLCLLISSVDHASLRNATTLSEIRHETRAVCDALPRAEPNNAGHDIDDDDWMAARCYVCLITMALQPIDVGADNMAADIGQRLDCMLQRGRRASPSVTRLAWTTVFLGIATCAITPAAVLSWRNCLQSLHPSLVRDRDDDPLYPVGISSHVVCYAATCALCAVKAHMRPTNEEDDDSEVAVVLKRRLAAVASVVVPKGYADRKVRSSLEFIVKVMHGGNREPSTAGTRRDSLCDAVSWILRKDASLGLLPAILIPRLIDSVSTVCERNVDARKTLLLPWLKPLHYPWLSLSHPAMVGRLAVQIASLLDRRRPQRDDDGVHLSLRLLLAFRHESAAYAAFPQLVDVLRLRNRETAWALRRRVQETFGHWRAAQSIGANGSQLPSAVMAPPSSWKEALALCSDPRLVSTMVAAAAAASGGAEHSDWKSLVLPTAMQLCADVGKYRHVFDLAHELLLPDSLVDASATSCHAAVPLEAAHALSEAVAQTSAWYRALDVVDLLLCSAHVGKRCNRKVVENIVRNTASALSERWSEALAFASLIVGQTVDFPSQQTGGSGAKPTTVGCPTAPTNFQIEEEEQRLTSNASLLPIALPYTLHALASAPLLNRLNRGGSWWRALETLGRLCGHPPHCVSEGTAGPTWWASVALLATWDPARALEVLRTAPPEVGGAETQHSCPLSPLQLVARQLSRNGHWEAALQLAASPADFLSALAGNPSKRQVQGLWLACATSVGHLYGRCFAADGEGRSASVLSSSWMERWWDAFPDNCFTDARILQALFHASDLHGHSAAFARKLLAKIAHLSSDVLRKYATALALIAGIQCDSAASNEGCVGEPNPLGVLDKPPITTSDTYLVHLLCTSLIHPRPAGPIVSLQWTPSLVEVLRGSYGNDVRAFVERHLHVDPYQAHSRDVRSRPVVGGTLRLFSFLHRQGGVWPLQKQKQQPASSLAPLSQTLPQPSIASQLIVHQTGAGVVVVRKPRGWATMDLAALVSKSLCGERHGRCVTTSGADAGPSNSLGQQQLYAMPLYQLHREAEGLVVVFLDPAMPRALCAIVYHVVLGLRRISDAATALLSTRFTVKYRMRLLHVIGVGDKVTGSEVAIVEARCASDPENGIPGTLYDLTRDMAVEGWGYCGDPANTIAERIFDTRTQSADPTLPLRTLFFLREVEVVAVTHDVKRVAFHVDEDLPEWWCGDGWLPPGEDVT